MKTQTKNPVLTWLLTALMVVALIFTAGTTVYAGDLDEKPDYYLDFSGSRESNPALYQAVKRVLLEMLRTDDLGSAVFDDAKQTIEISTHGVTHTTLDLSNQNLTSLEGIEALKRWESITSLQLNNNNITDLKPLLDLQKLKKLELSGNSLNDDDLVDLSDLKNLHTLNLSNTNITAELDLSKLTSLTILVLSGNNLTNVPNLSSLTGLLVLELSDNNLTAVPNLSTSLLFNNLDLSGNNITDFSHLSEIKNLARLTLNENNLTDISELVEELTKLESLEDLYLNSNNISDASEIISLKNLDTLQLNDNNITELPELGSLTELTQLELNNNQISDFSELSKLPKLNLLKLDGNNISDLTHLSQVLSVKNTVKSLSLNHNNITDLSPLSGLVELVNLILTDNSITDISPLNSLIKLNNLHLDKNNITELPSLNDIKQLYTLTLSDNNITNVSPLSDLVNLVWLNLSGNKIKDFSPLDALMDTLGYYDFGGQRLGSSEIYVDPTNVNSPDVQDSIGDAKDALGSDVKTSTLPDNVEVERDENGDIISATVGATVPENGNIGIYTMRLLARSENVSLLVTIGEDSGMEITITGGFTEPNEPGRIHYPLGYSEVEAEKSTISRLPTLTADQIVHSFKLGSKTSNTVLPTTAKLSCTTDLSDGTAVKVYRYNIADNTVSEVAVTTVTDGKVSFGTAVLGEFAVVLG